MTIEITRNARGRATAVDADLTLADVLPIPKPHANNAALKQAVAYLSFDPADSYYSRSGDEFYRGVNAVNLAETMSTYRLSDKAAAVRDRLSDDIALRSKQTRVHRRNYQPEGTRIGSAYEYTRWRRGAVTEPRFWEQRVRREQPRKGTLVIHTTASAHAAEDAMSLEWTGAVAVALTDLLESLGYRVVLRAVNASEMSAGIMNMAVTVKEADEVVSEHALAVMCHGGVNRLLRFAFRMSTDMICDSDMGSPKPYTGKLLADITVPHNVRSLAAAEQFIAETMLRYQSDELDEDERREENAKRMAASRSVYGV